MALSIVQDIEISVGGNATNTHNVAYGSNVAAGNLLVASVMYDSTNNTGTLADSQGNTWTMLGQYNQTADAWSTYLAWTTAGSSAANTVTFTLTSGIAGAFGIKLYEVNQSGTVTWSLDGTATGTTQAAAANPNVGSVTTTASESFAVANLIKAQLHTAGTGWTLAHSTTISGSKGSTEHRITSGSGAINGEFVEATSSQFGGGIAAWKATASGGSRPMFRGS